ncbi:MAG: hypothetical protein P1P77_08120 [Spirochaetaceae bacterium]|nr:hypothetical protein [Spirochaetaceae bacterium]
MKRTDWVHTRALGIAIILLGTLMMSSCLDLQTNIRLTGDGEVSAKITYIFNEDSAGFGRGFGSDEPWPLPLTEKDFRQRQLRYPGVDLKTYRAKTRRDGGEEIEVRLKSESLEALAAYLDMDFHLEGSVKDGSFVLKIPDITSYTETTDVTREVFEKLTRGMVFRFRFRPPGRPTESQNGSIEGRYASFDITMAEILSGETPSQWLVSW